MKWIDTVVKMLRVLWPFVYDREGRRTRLSKEHSLELATAILGFGVALGLSWLENVDPTQALGVYAGLRSVIGAFRRQRESDAEVGR